MVCQSGICDTIKLMFQKGFSSVVILVGILVLVGVAGGAYFLGKSAKVEPAKVVSAPQLTLQPTSVSQPSASPTGEFKQIPLPIKWIKYQATCKSLADHVEIYYPDNWLPKEFANITDVPDPDSQECQVIFGYPLPVQSYQSPTPGVLASFKVQSFIDKTETLDQRVQIIGKQDPLPKSITKINLNGVIWYRVDYEQYSTWLSTKLNDRFIEIYLMNSYTRTGDNLDKLIILGNTNTLNTEILNRIKLIP